MLRCLREKAYWAEAFLKKFYLNKGRYFKIWGAGDEETIQ
jgi:hypothetical protein